MMERGKREKERRVIQPRARRLFMGLLPQHARSWAERGPVALGGSSSDSVAPQSDTGLAASRRLADNEGREGGGAERETERDEGGKRERDERDTSEREKEREMLRSRAR
jgi:hypothetical protein